MAVRCFGSIHRKNHCDKQALTAEESVEYLQSEDRRNMSKSRMKANESKLMENDKKKDTESERLKSSIMPSSCSSIGIWHGFLQPGSFLLVVILYHHTSC